MDMATLQPLPVAVAANNSLTGLTQNAQKPAHIESLKKWAISTDFSQTARIVVDSMERGNIRALAKTDGFYLSLAVTAELEFSIRTYSGVTDFDDAQITEFTQLVLSEFAHLGVTEIREAFRLVSIGTVKNGEKVIDLRAYRDVFTGAVLGDVLRCYDEFRKAEIVKGLQVEQARLASLESERHTLEEQELKHQRNERAIDVRIEQLREMKEPDLAKVWGRDYEWLKRRNLIVMTKEQMMKIYEQAKGQYLIEVKNNLWSDKKEVRQTALVMIGLIEKGQETEELKEKYQETARRLAVLWWIEQQQSLAVPASGDGKLAV